MIINDLLLSFGDLSKDNLFDYIIILHELSIFHHKVEIMHFVKHHFFSMDLQLGHIFFTIAIDFFFKSFSELLILFNILCLKGFFELDNSQVIKLEVLVFTNVNSIEDRVKSNFIFFFLLDYIDIIDHLS